MQRTLLVNEFRLALIDLLVELADGSLQAFDLCAGIVIVQLFTPGAFARF